MRVAALLSGGKDSVAAIELAQGFAWDVACVIVLEPQEDDAWMFHTPNLNLAKAIGEALGVPVRSFSTRPDPEDEVADLEEAIRLVHQEFQLDGILSGALASEYQRTRIERIGHRLGLKTFAPLWHKDPATYMASLLQAGYDLRFSRVAAEGVPKSWAGQPLTAECLEHMRNHSARPHIAGEGGEYESAVLNAPHYKAPVQVDASHVHETASRATWIVEALHV